MALPTNVDLQTMDYGFAGEPFVNVPTVSTVDTLTMDYGFAGEPFVTNPGGVQGPTNLKTWCGVPKANIKTINGIPLANVKSINGLT